MQANKLKQTLLLLLLLFFNGKESISQWKPLGCQDVSLDILVVFLLPWKTAFQRLMSTSRKADPRKGKRKIPEDIFEHLDPAVPAASNFPGIFLFPETINSLFCAICIAVFLVLVPENSPTNIFWPKGEKYSLRCDTNEKIERIACTWLKIVFI